MDSLMQSQVEAAKTLKKGKKKATRITVCQRGVSLTADWT